MNTINKETISSDLEKVFSLAKKARKTKMAKLLFPDLILKEEIEGKFSFFAEEFDLKTFDKMELKVNVSKVEKQGEEVGIKKGEQLSIISGMVKNGEKIFWCSGRGNCDASSKEIFFEEYYGLENEEYEVSIIVEFRLKKDFPY